MININTKEYQNLPSDEEDEEKVGGDLIIERYSRSVTYKTRKQKSCCVKFFGGVFHEYINEKVKMKSRFRRITTHLFCGLLNLLSCGIIAAYFFLFDMVETIFFEEKNTAYHKMERESQFITDSIDVKSIMKPSMGKSQKEILTSKYGLEAIEIQRKFFCLNTLLFASIPTKDFKEKEKGEIQKGLTEWNELTEKVLSFSIYFYKGFKKVLRDDIRVKKLYKGQYKYLVKDVKKMKEIDEKTQRMFFYKTNLEVEKKIPFSKEIWEKIIKDTNNDLTTIKKRVEKSTFFVSSKYINSLPEKATSILDYGVMFKKWKQSKGDINQFLILNKIDISENSSGKEIIELRKKFEDICLIWKEKKGKNKKTSAKLRTAKIILKELKKKINRESTLSYMMKSSTDDVATMIRSLYNEVLIGRMKALKRYYEMPVSSEIQII